MRDIREDLKERVASITSEMDELKKRQSLLTSIQQSLFGLLEEEDRRFRDHIPSITEPTPKGLYSESATKAIYSESAVKAIYSEPAAKGIYSEPATKGIYSESTTNGLYGTEHPKPISTEPAKAVKVTMGSWAGDQRKTES